MGKSRCWGGDSLSTITCDLLRILFCGPKSTSLEMANVTKWQGTGWWFFGIFCPDYQISSTSPSENFIKICIYVLKNYMNISQKNDILFILM